MKDKEKSDIGLRVKNSLKKFPNHRNLTTLVSEEAYKKMLEKYSDGLVFTGKKHYDEEMNSTFDVLFNYKDISELPNLNSEDTSVVPYFNSLTIGNPQEYFLSLNRKFPYVEKFFLGFNDKKPKLFTLSKSKRAKMFIPGSYILLD